MAAITTFPQISSAIFSALCLRFPFLLFLLFFFALFVVFFFSAAAATAFCLLLLLLSFCATVCPATAKYADDDKDNDKGKGCHGGRGAWKGKRVKGGGGRCL